MVDIHQDFSLTLAIDDWFCTRCIQRRIGRASDWFERLLYTLKGPLQNTTPEQPSNAFAGLPNAISSNPFAYESGYTVPSILSHAAVPVTVDLPVRGIRGNPRPTPEGFPQCTDLVICDARESQGSAALSDSTKVLEDSTIIQKQTVCVGLTEARTDRTPSVGRKTSTTKQYMSSETKTKTTVDRMDSAESGSGLKYGSDYSAHTDPTELHEDLSDEYPGEESEVSMLDD